MWDTGPQSLLVACCPERGKSKAKRSENLVRGEDAWPMGADRRIVCESAKLWNRAKRGTPGSGHETVR